MKEEQSELLRRFSPEERTAIDALNSKYTYQHVIFFRQAVYDIFYYNNKKCLNKTQVNMNAYYIQVMLNLIDYPYKPFVIEREIIDDFLIETEIIIEPVEPEDYTIAAYMEWIFNLLQGTEVTTLSVLDSYYSKFPFTPKRRKDHKPKSEQWFI